MKYLNYFMLWSGLFLTITAFGQNFNADNISKDLLKNANAVIRLYERSFTVSDTDKATYTGHIVITILNKSGEAYAALYDSYDKFEKITEIKGKIYNGKGDLIRKIKTSDFTDQSVIANNSLYEDNRVKFFVPSINKYPYTVEYEYSGTLSGILSYPNYNPQYGYDLSVESSLYKITVPSKLNISFKKVNYDLEPKMTEVQNNKTYAFEFKNLNAVESETYSPGIVDLVPIIYIIPKYFKCENYTGSNSTWKELGAFQHLLNTQENNLSDKTKADIADLKTKSKDRLDLIKKIYEYMQSKTRYVNITEGIGGLKPMDASIVDKFGYGDCKALSNYMKTLLKEVNIESIYTKVRAGADENDIYTDISFHQSNHIILCVPDKKDTIWLECTSQIIPFGFLGDFTNNRHVLLITDNGGVIAKTPKYTKEKNILNRNASVTIREDGNAESSIKTKYTGLQYDDHIRLLISPADKQKEQLYSEIDIPSFTINDFKLEEHKELLPWFNETLHLTINKCASVMGNRLFLSLNLMNKRSAISTVMKERKTHLKLRYPYSDVDSVTYHLPKGFSVEFVPPPYEITSEFGSYSTKVIKSQDNGSVLYIRNFEMNDGLFPPEKYKDYVAFIKEVSKQDNSKISLIKAQ